ncbi:hypothetical protein C823_004813 [Eubacterium plexicaudatum ASF492]|nr:hypothetical protein C823_004813 [Eubacterium plexicaudatum ASF492]
MMLSDRDMKNFLERKIQIPCNESNMQEAILKSKKAYYKTEEEKFLSKAEFLYQQSRYIKKRWWLIQGLLLKYLGSNCYIQRSIGIAAPLFVLLIIPEMWKNRNANAMEVECTTLYSIRQVYAARMILFAFVDLVLLSLFLLRHLILTDWRYGNLSYNILYPLMWLVAFASICYTAKGQTLKF